MNNIKMYQFSAVKNTLDVNTKNTESYAVHCHWFS